MSFRYLSCAESEKGSTLGFSSHTGNDSPDSVYLLTIWQPSTLFLTTCNGNTDFYARILLFDGPPSEPGTTQLSSSDQATDSSLWTGTSQSGYTQSRATAVGCASLVYYFDGPKTVYVAVEGASSVDQGIFELSAVCDVGYDPAVEESCLYSFLACGESLKGSLGTNPGPTLFETEAYPGVTGDRVYMLAVEGSSDVALSTCNAYSTVDTTIFLFDGPPNEYDPSAPRSSSSFLLAVSDPTSSCGALQATVPREGSYYVVVRAQTTNATDVGPFELTSQCIPQPTPLSDCPYTYVGCGDVVQGSTVGHGSFLDENLRDPKPDALFLLTVFDPVSVAVTSCETNFKFRAHLSLFGRDAPPTHPNATLLATSAAQGLGMRGREMHASGSFQQNGLSSSTTSGDCSTLIYDLPVSGAYWLLVEHDLSEPVPGYGTENLLLTGGLFELRVGCDPLPVTPPNASCGYSYATCGDTLRGTTRGFPDKLGLRSPGGPDLSGSPGGALLSNPDGRPEQVYLLAVEAALQRVELSTCAHPDSAAHFPARFMVFDGSPFARNSTLVADSQPLQGHRSAQDAAAYGAGGDETLVGGCATLSVLLTGPKSYFVVVEGALDTASARELRRVHGGFSSLPDPSQGGYFEATVSCEAVPMVEEPSDLCHHSFIGCGDRVIGTTVGFPSYVDDSGQRAGERVYLLTVDAPTTVSLSTCGADPLVSSWRPKLSVFDGPPHEANNTAPYTHGSWSYGAAARRLADSAAARYHDCAVVVADLPVAGAYYVVVGGDDSGALSAGGLGGEDHAGVDPRKLEGVFELSVGCQRLPIDAIDDSCGASMATCGDSLIGTTRGFPSFTPWSRAPDKRYSIAVDGPTLLTLSTCGTTLTNFNLAMYLYAGYPDPNADPFWSPWDDVGSRDSNFDEGAWLLADSRASLQAGCVTLAAELPSAGTYYVVVSGANDDDEGEFEIAVGCSDLLSSQNALKPEVVNATYSADGLNSSSSSNLAKYPVLSCGSEVVGNVDMAPFELYAPDMDNNQSYAEQNQNPRNLRSRVYLAEIDAPSVASASTCAPNPFVSRATSAFAQAHSANVLQDFDTLGHTVAIYKVAAKGSALYRNDDDDNDDNTGSTYWASDYKDGGSRSSGYGHPLKATDAFPLESGPFPSELLFTTSLPTSTEHYASSSATYVPLATRQWHASQSANVNDNEERVATLADLLVTADVSTGECASTSASLDAGVYAIVVTPVDPSALFHLSWSCDAPKLVGADPEGCADTALSCGELVTGSTAELTADWLWEDNVPEAVHLLAAPRPLRVTVSACSRWVSDFQPHLWVLDGHPTLEDLDGDDNSEGHASSYSLLAQSSLLTAYDGLSDCASVTALLPRAGTYTIVVGGRADLNETTGQPLPSDVRREPVPSDVGVYELSVSCEALDLKTLDETCAVSYVGCGDSLLGTNAGFPDFAGRMGDSGDALYLLPIDGPVWLSLSTCSNDTTFATQVAVYAQGVHPRDVLDQNGQLVHEGSVLARSDPSEPCGEVLVLLPLVGSYWISVGGVGDPHANSVDPAASPWSGGEGLFRLSLQCAALSVTPASEACMANFATCGETLMGSTDRHPAWRGPEVGPAAVHLLALNEATRVAVTTCTALTSFPTTLTLLEAGADPRDANASLVVARSEDHVMDSPHTSSQSFFSDGGFKQPSAAMSSSRTCSTLIYDAPSRGAYALIVSSATPEATSLDQVSGIYELVIGCQDLLPSALESSCPYSYLTCSDVVVGTNVGYPNFAGSEGADALYLVTVDEPTRLSLSTCSQATSFTTSLTLYDKDGGVPLPLNATGSAAVLAKSTDANGCSTLFADLHAAGAYWLLVEGQGAQDAGVFELSAACYSFGVLPTDCAYKYLHCGDSVVGSTAGRPNWIGSPAPDSVYLVSVFEGATIALTTCSSLTSFPTRLLLLDGPPSAATPGTLLAASSTTHEAEAAWASGNWGGKEDEEEGYGAGGALFGSLWSNLPPAAGNEVACSTLTYTTTEAQALWLVVEGASEGDEGLFELTAACQELGSVRPPPQTCGYRYMSCGDSVKGSTLGQPDHTGNGAGDSTLLLAVDGPTSMTATLCADVTASNGSPNDGGTSNYSNATTLLQPRLLLFDAAPSSERFGRGQSTEDDQVGDDDGFDNYGAQEHLLRVSDQDASGCAVLVFDLPAAGAYWLVVDAASPEAEGSFELTALCAESHWPNLLSDGRPLECGGVALAATQVRKEIQPGSHNSSSSSSGDNGNSSQTSVGSMDGEARFTIPVDAATRISLSTCARATSYKTRLALLASEGASWAQMSADDDEDDVDDEMSSDDDYDSDDVSDELAGYASALFDQAGWEQFPKEDGTCSASCQAKGKNQSSTTTSVQGKFPMPRVWAPSPPRDLSLAAARARLPSSFASLTDSEARRVVAISDEHTPCALFADLPLPGDYELVVVGGDQGGEHGLVEVSVLCDDVAIDPPGTPLTCSGSVVGTYTGFSTNTSQYYNWTQARGQNAPANASSFFNLGDDDDSTLDEAFLIAEEALYRVVVPRAGVQLAASTCSNRTSFRTRLDLFAGSTPVNARNESQWVATSSRADSNNSSTFPGVSGECATLFYTAPLAGIYWVAVAGASSAEMGIFELNLACNDVNTPLVNASSHGADSLDWTPQLACNGRHVGSTLERPLAMRNATDSSSTSSWSSAGSPAPDRVLVVAVDGPTSLSFSTCSPLTAFNTQLLLFDEHPSSDSAELLAIGRSHARALTSMELAVSSGSPEASEVTCAVMFYEYRAEQATTLFVVVDGRTTDDAGLFELSLVCKDASGPSLDDSCGTEIHTCGESVEGSTVGYPDYFGDGSGDSLFVVTVFEATRISLSVCDARTNFDAVVSLYRGLPWQGGELLTSSDENDYSNAQECASLFHALPLDGAYHIVVSGASPGEEGSFTLHITCDDLGVVALQDSCGIDVLTCGDSVVGTTEGFVPLVDGMPVAVHSVSVFGANQLAVSTCNELTSFAAVVSIYDEHPLTHPNAVLLAQSSDAQECAAAFWNAGVAGTYYVVVSGQTAQDYGLYSLSVLCEAEPVMSVGDSCGMQHYGCGDSFLGTNYGYPDFVGYESPDAHYRVVVFEPQRLSVSTCSSKTSFKTHLHLYSGKPNTEGSELLASAGPKNDDDAAATSTSSDGLSDRCASLVHLLDAPGVYWLAVEGRSARDVGVFEVGLTCEQIPGVTPLVDRAYEMILTCGDSVAGQTNGYPSYGGSDAPDALYRVALFGPTELVATTCSTSLTTFNAQLVLMEGSPGNGGTEVARTSSTSGSDEGGCASVFFTSNGPQSLYVLVDGVTSDDAGLFELSLACKDLSGPTLEEACFTNLRTCGESVEGSTVGYPDYFGDGSGDSLFVVTVFEATRISLSVCDARTNFDAVVSLYRGLPTAGGELLASSVANSGMQPCAALIATLPTDGAYHVVVSGAVPGDEGIFTLHITCEDLDVAPMEDSCGTSVLTCSDRVVGTTEGYAAFVDGTSPSALHIVSAFQAMHIAVSTCDQMTSFNAVVTVFDGHPSSPNSTLIAQSSDTQECAAAFVDMPVAGNYYVAVSGQTSEDYGLYGLSIVCEAAPVVSVGDSCGMQHYGCGDSFLGTNYGYPDFVGSPAPDALYRLVIFKPTRLAISTCGDATSFGTRLLLFSGNPTVELGLLPVAEGESDLPCALFYNVDVPGSYWLAVEGSGDHEGAASKGQAAWAGVFEASVLCQDRRLPTASEACAARYVSCGDAFVGSNVGFPNMAGSGGPDVVFRWPVFGATAIVATTCGPATSFETELLLYDRMPLANAGTTVHSLGGSSGRRLGGNGGWFGNNDDNDDDQSPAVLLASSHEGGGRDMPCTTLFYEVNREATLYLVVGGASKEEVGSFELRLLCDDISSPPHSDSCGAQLVSCGDEVRGTTVGYPDLAEGPAGDAIFQVVAFGAGDVLALSTCLAGSHGSNNGAAGSFRSGIVLYGEDPRGELRGNATLLARSMPNDDEACATLFYTAPAPGTYFALVTSPPPSSGGDDDGDNEEIVGSGGRRRAQEGEFVFTVLCDSGPTLPAVEDSCALEYLACGDTLTATTVGRPNFVDGGAQAEASGGDATGGRGHPAALHPLLVFGPSRMAVTVCTSAVEHGGWRPRVRLYSNDPTMPYDPSDSEYAYLIAESFGDAKSAGVVGGNNDKACATVLFDAPRPGTYFAVVSASELSPRQDGGLFELGVSCEPLAPAFGDTCGAQLLSCGDVVRGTNVGRPAVTTLSSSSSNGAPAAEVYRIALFGASDVTFSTCSVATSFPVRLRLFDSDPTADLTYSNNQRNNAVELASATAKLGGSPQGEHGGGSGGSEYWDDDDGYGFDGAEYGVEGLHDQEGCVTLSYRTMRAKTLFLAVEGVTANDVGVFDLSVLCKSLPSESGTDGETCGAQVLTCGEVVDGTTVGHHSWVGNPSGDRVYQVASFGPATQVMATTCSSAFPSPGSLALSGDNNGLSSREAFDSRLLLYRGNPATDPNATMLVASNDKSVHDGSEPCATLSYTLPSSGSFFLVVEGATDMDEGLFSLTVLCAAVPGVETVDDSCGGDVLTCGDVVAGTNANFPDWGKDGSGDAIYALTFFEAVKVSLSTCSARGGFQAQLWLFDTHPAEGIPWLSGKANATEPIAEAHPTRVQPGCSALFFDIPAAGLYYVVVESDDLITQPDGLFELTVLCEDAAPEVEESCVTTVLACGDSAVGQLVPGAGKGTDASWTTDDDAYDDDAASGGVNSASEERAEMLYVLTVFDAADYVLTTCSVETSVEVVLSVHDAPTVFDSSHRLFKNATSGEITALDYANGTDRSEDWDEMLGQLGNSTLLHTTAGSTQPCAALFFKAEAFRSYYISVRAKHPGGKGIFHLSALCSAPLAPPLEEEEEEVFPPFNLSMCFNTSTYGKNGPPKAWDGLCPPVDPCPEATEQPTTVPTLGVSTLPEPVCAYRHLTCGDAFLDTNEGAPNELGRSSSGDVFYLLSVFDQKLNLTVTICPRTEGFVVRMSAYEAYPLNSTATEEGNSSTSAIASAVSNDAVSSADGCAEVDLTGVTEGSYWLHVEGDASGITNHGVFNVEVSCDSPAPTPAPTPGGFLPCAYDYLTCDDSTNGSTWGLSNVAGGEGGDALFAFSLFAPKRVTLSTCTGVTDFATVLQIFEEWPGNQYGDYLSDAVPRPLNGSLSARNRIIDYKQNPLNRTCATLTAVLTAGSYWLMLEGRNGTEGNYELLAFCAPHDELSPTPLPTPVPTPQPTPLPSPLPTTFECVADLVRLEPEILVASGTAYALGNEAKSSATRGLFSREFGGLFGGVPGSSFSFGAYVGGGVQVGANGGGGTVAKASCSGGQIALVVKETIVYHDDLSQKVAFQIVDAFGRPQIETSGLSVTMALVTSLGSSSSITCSTPSSTTGIGSCSTTISASWFSTANDVTVSATVTASYGSVAALVSDTVTFTLEQEPTFTALSGAGMVAVVPHHPVLPGTTYSVSITANTNGQALSVWVLSFAFDTSVLTYSSTATSNLYTSAVVTTSTGKISMSTSGLSSGVSTGDVTGSDISIVTVKFRVSNSASVGAQSNSLSFVASQMVNQFSIAFASNVAGQINDERGGAQTSCQTTVDEVSYLGIFSYAANHELVNTAPLDGTTVTSAIKSYAIRSKASYSDVLVGSSSLTCALADADDSDVLAVGSCVVQLQSTAHTTGSGRVAVEVTYGALVAGISPTFRVWFPTIVDFTVSDSLLSRISEKQDCARFQRAELSAFATFSTNSSNSTDTVVDVSSVVGFASSDASRLAIGTAGKSMTIARGISNGTASVSLNVPASGNPGCVVAEPVEVEVSTEPVGVDRLRVSVYSGADWAISNLGEIGLYGVATPELQFVHELVAEGDTASVAIYAYFDDGYSEVITGQARLKSLAPTSISVTSNTSVEVPVGASSFCGQGLVAYWPVCGAVAGTGRGVVDVVMPAATGVTITVSSSKLAQAGDGASAAPFSVATTVTITVLLDFEDGTTQDYSTDSRTQYEVVTDDDGGVSNSTIKLNGVNTIGVKDRAELPFDAAVACSVFVSFPGVHPLNGTATVRVVRMASLELFSQPYPEVSNYYAAFGNQLILRRVSCAGLWQRSHFTARGKLSDGTTQSSLNFYKRVSYASSNLTVATLEDLCFSGSCRVVVPSAVGSVTILGDFYGVNASLTLNVVADKALVTSVALKADIGSASTLTGVVGTTDVAATTVTFDDNTNMVVAYSGYTSSAWLSPDLLLTYDSDNRDAFNVSSVGIVSLIANYYDFSTLTVTDICGSGATDDLAIYTNLKPEVYDVDMGATTKAPFGSIAVGDTLSVNVRIQADGSFDLTAFQVIVTFDYNLLQVNSDSDCVQGNGWSSTWACTTNDPNDEVLLVGSCGLSPSSGCGTRGLLTVATIKFTAKAVGAVYLSADIVKLKDDANTITDTVAFAGSDLLIITAARRRLLGMYDQQGYISYGANNSLGNASHTNSSSSSSGGPKPLSMALAAHSGIVNGLGVSPVNPSSDKSMPTSSQRFTDSHVQLQAPPKGYTNAVDSSGKEHVAIRSFSQTSVHGPQPAPYSYWAALADEQALSESGANVRATAQRAMMPPEERASQDAFLNELFGMHPIRVTNTSSSNVSTSVVSGILSLNATNTTVPFGVAGAGADDAICYSRSGHQRAWCMGAPPAHWNVSHLLTPFAASSPLQARRRLRARQEARRQLNYCDQLLGDTNGDCVCDVEDVQYLQFFIGGSVLSSDLSSQQLKAMDPDLDGDSDGVDISYLTNVVANKYRFLANFTAIGTPFVGVSISTELRTVASDLASSQTNLYYEIGTQLNELTVWSAGNNISETSDGLYIAGEQVSPGAYAAIGDPPFTEKEIGIVVMVETTDANGDTSEDRKFAFYCTRLYASCVSVYGDNSDAFRPFAYIDMIGPGTATPSLAPSPVPTGCDRGGDGFGNYLLLESPDWVNQSHCAYQHLTCGDLEVGSNIGAPEELGNPDSGDLFYMISVFETPKYVAISSCRPSTVISLRLTLYLDFPARGVERVERQGTYYGSNATMIAQSDEYDDCGVVVAPLDPGTYWLHVEGNTSIVNNTLVPAEGSFELAVLCQENVIPEPFVDNSPCAYDYITCGDTVVGSNVGRPNLQGNSSGDVHFLLSVFGPQSVYLTTCTKFTNFDAIITVYRDYPSDTSVPTLFSQTSKGQWNSKMGDGCSFVNVDFQFDDFEDPGPNGQEGGGFWVTVDGLGDSEGDFELIVQCSPGPTSSPTIGATPYPTHGACDFTGVICNGPSVTSNTAFYGDFGGGPAKEQNFVITLFEPKRLVADVCAKVPNAEFQINATVWLYDDCPASGGKIIANATGSCLNEFILYESGTYWLLVEAVGGIEDYGEFEFELTCTAPPSPAPSPAPTAMPTLLPTLSVEPTPSPTVLPSAIPTALPTLVCLCTFYHLSWKCFFPIPPFFFFFVFFFFFKFLF